MRIQNHFSVLALAAALFCAPSPATAQQPKPSATKITAAPEKSAAQLDLLETRYRFASNGDWRKEVHAVVKINNELGARQFAKLNFDFNRGFQSVEIPLVRVTHAGGGTVDILPGAITDTANPAVADAPAYQDARIKSVRILGLAPGDSLEYRVVTNTIHPPLAPDFWLDHSFDRSGIVSKEIFDLDLPATPKIELKLPPGDSAPANGSHDAARVAYHWEKTFKPAAQDSEKPAPSVPDISLSTFASWPALAERLSLQLQPTPVDLAATKERAAQLVAGKNEPLARLQAIYDFVSQKIRTIDLPIGATGFRARPAEQILASGYGTAEEKFRLFAALAAESAPSVRAAFVSADENASRASAPSPASFAHLLTLAATAQESYWFDLNLEVAPFGMFAPELRDRAALLVPAPPDAAWQSAKENFGFPSGQRVLVNGSIAGDGTFAAKITYIMRGDNELLLRIAFHQTPKDRWKEVAQLLAISDGYRGQIGKVDTSDPYATSEPFRVEYEITTPKFVDWSKKPVRIPAMLPLAGLPDAPAAADIAAGKKIDLGTPLTVDLASIIRLPAGTTAQSPIGTSVTRDYAMFHSQYSVDGTTLHAVRSLYFLEREIPAARATDFNAFLHAVQSDQVQPFLLHAPAAGSAPAASTSGKNNP